MSPEICQWGSDATAYLLTNFWTPGEPRGSHNAGSWATSDSRAGD